MNIDFRRRVAAGPRQSRTAPIRGASATYWLARPLFPEPLAMLLLSPFLCAWVAFREARHG